MKTLLLILLFAFAGVEIMYGQQVASAASLNAEKCTTDTEIDFLRECLSKYYAQRKRAYYAAGSSVARSDVDFLLRKDVEFRHRFDQVYEKINESNYGN
jgi:hypothetical protein